MIAASHHVTSLSESERERCEQIACAFDEAWHQDPGHPPDIDTFLPGEALCAWPRPNLIG